MADGAPLHVTFPVVKGFTLLELLVVMTLAAIIMGIAVPSARDALDRTAVRTAAADVRATLSMARALALAGHAVVTVEIDSVAGSLRVRRGADAALRRDVRAAHGVQVTATRDSLSYDAYGLGRGAANLSVVIRRGAAVDTVFVSRLGRIR